MLTIPSRATKLIQARTGQSDRCIPRAGLDTRQTYHMEVPTVMGRFAVNATEAGVAMIFFPETDSAKMADRLTRSNLIPGPGGKDRAIEAGLELMGYLLGEVKQFTTPVDLSFVTPFQRDVYCALGTISFGETITYGELAALAGHAGKARAVGSAVGSNPAPLFVPCHRVLPARGGIGGWSGPPGWKETLLSHEGLSEWVS